MRNLINVFEDTLRMSKTIHNRSSTTKHTFDDILKQLYRFEKHKPSGILNLDNITVINSDTVSSIVEWSKRGKTCGINMASYRRPGGGVANGARAQEESLFRCSNLPLVVDRKFYPLQENECLYTENAIFFKDANYDLMDPVECDIITIAALRLSGVVTDKGLVKFEPEDESIDYEQITKDKIRLMCSVPVMCGAKNLILGAWGCGVFKNDPTNMAKYFKEVLVNEGYANMYDNVIFAIINDHNSVGSNYEIFKKILS